MSKTVFYFNYLILTVNSFLAQKKLEKILQQTRNSERHYASIDVWKHMYNFIHKNENEYSKNAYVSLLLSV